MKRWYTTLSVLGLAALCAGACAAPTNPFQGDMAATDASSSEGGGCTSNAACDDRTACTTDLCLVGGVCDHHANNSMCAAGQTCISGRGCVTPGQTTCTSSAGCDDMVACTRDTCLVDMTCRHEPMDALCTVAGQHCDAARGCVTGSTGHCATAADCDDMIGCTMDLCGADGTCAHVAQNNLCPGGQTCNAGMGCIVVTNCSNAAQCDDHMYCNGAETCSSELACVMGTPPSCDDMDACTHDECDETSRGCTHTMEPSCMGMMVRSGFYDLAPPVDVVCTAGGATAIMTHTAAFQFSIVGTAMTASGGPTTLRGISPMPAIGGHVDLTGMNSGSCIEVYHLQGAFTDATHFSGVMTLNFVDTLPPIGCLGVTCTTMNWPVMGTLRM